VLEEDGGARSLLFLHDLYNDSKGNPKGIDAKNALSNGRVIEVSV